MSGKVTVLCLLGNRHCVMPSKVGFALGDGKVGGAGVTEETEAGGDEELGWYHWRGIEASGGGTVIRFSE